MREVIGWDAIPLSGVLSRACGRVVYFEWSETVLVFNRVHEGFLYHGADKTGFSHVPNVSIAWTDFALVYTPCDLSLLAICEK